MSRKAVATILIAGLALAGAAAFRAANRADAAPGDCYADSKGPSEPTICH
jgi:hypothetical protein